MRRFVTGLAVMALALAAVSTEPDQHVRSTECRSTLEAAPAVAAVDVAPTSLELEAHETVAPAPQEALAALRGADVVRDVPVLATAPDGDGSGLLAFDVPDTGEPRQSRASGLLPETGANALRWHSSSGAQHRQPDRPWACFTPLARILAV